MLAKHLIRKLLDPQIVKLPSINRLNKYTKFKDLIVLPQNSQIVG
jgi:hypothetical protein